MQKKKKDNTISDEPSKPDIKLQTNKTKKLSQSKKSATTSVIGQTSQEHEPTDVRRDVIGQKSSDVTRDTVGQNVSDNLNMSKNEQSDTDINDKNSEMKTHRKYYEDVKKDMYLEYTDNIVSIGLSLFVTNHLIGCINQLFTRR